MFSITMHRVYLAVFAAVTLALAYMGLSRAYTEPVFALTCGLYALGGAFVFGLFLHRWLQLEYLWNRALMLLVPSNATEVYRKTVRATLNTVLSKKTFRHEMKRVLNKEGVFKLFVDNGTPVVQLDIAFPDTWDRHNYLRCALGWIATCMPATVTCHTLERKGSRLVFRFVHSDVQRKDAQGLHTAVREWKSNIQKLLVMHLDKCSVQDLNYVPQKISVRAKKFLLPEVPNTAFDEDVLLTEEQVRLHIGFNGSTYYTYFEDGVTTQVHGRREYQSWEALWSVWQHMSEVQAAFQPPRKTVPTQGVPAK